MYYLIIHMKSDFLLNNRTVGGFKRFYSPLPLDSPKISIHGIGIREPMPPSRIERPNGREDWLLMLFHDSACASTHYKWDEKNPPGSMMIWPPEKAQYYGHPDRPYAHTWIHCAGSRIRSIIACSGLPLLKPFPVTSSARLEACLGEIHHELISYIHPDPTIVGNLLENCLRDMARNMNRHASVISIPEGLLAVRQLISEVPALPLPLSKMASLAKMSPSNFCLCFKKLYGVPPGECLIQHRMQHAAFLLANKSLTITEIGQRVGYPDPFHFSKLFKKHFGTGPRAFRKNQI